MASEAFLLLLQSKIQAVLFDCAHSACFRDQSAIWNLAYVGSLACLLWLRNVADSHLHFAANLAAAFSFLLYLQSRLRLANFKADFSFGPTATILGEWPTRRNSPRASRWWAYFFCSCPSCRDSASFSATKASPQENTSRSRLLTVCLCQKAKKLTWFMYVPNGKSPFLWLSSKAK